MSNQSSGGNMGGGVPTRAPRPFSRVLLGNMRRVHIVTGRAERAIHAHAEAALAQVLGAVTIVGAGWTTNADARLRAAAIVGLAVENAIGLAWDQPLMRDVRNVAECACADAVNRCVKNARAEFIPDDVGRLEMPRRVEGLTLDERARANVRGLCDEMKKRILAQALLAQNGIDFVRRSGIVVKHFGGRLGSRLASDYKAYAAHEVRSVTAATLRGLTGNAENNY